MKMMSHGFANKLQLWLSGADCESLLSNIYHVSREIYPVIEYPKYPLQNVWEKSTACDSLKMFL